MRALTYFVALVSLSLGGCAARTAHAFLLCDPAPGYCDAVSMRPRGIIEPAQRFACCKNDAGVMTYLGGPNSSSDPVQALESPVGTALSHMTIPAVP